MIPPLGPPHLLKMPHRVAQGKTRCATALPDVTQLTGPNAHFYLDRTEHQSTLAMDALWANMRFVVTLIRQGEGR